MSKHHPSKALGSLTDVSGSPRTPKEDPLRNTGHQFRTRRERNPIPTRRHLSTTRSPRPQSGVGDRHGTEATQAAETETAEVAATRTRRRNDGG